jgi:hypothetical protein
MKLYERSREKDKREARTIARYLLFYMACIFVLAFSTNLLDHIFYWMGYGTKYPSANPVMEYAVEYAILGFISFPLSFGYNWLINQIMDQSIWLRFALGISFSMIVGSSLDLRYEFGYYSGEHIQLKNVLAMVVSGIFIELLRSLVVYIRMRVL